MTLQATITIAGTSGAIDTLAVAGGGAALATFALYSMLVFGLAWLSHRVLVRRPFLAEYFLGSRELKTLAFALTFGATAASAGTFAGYPALVYTHGWSLALWIASYMIFPLCGMALLGKRLNQFARRTGAVTLPDVLRDRFESPTLAVTSTLLMVFLLSFYLVPQFKTASLIIRQVLSGAPAFEDAAGVLATATRSWPGLAGVDAEYLLCLLLFAVLVIAYTTFGGFRAVVWTDMLQAGVMVVGVMTMLVLALWQVGGLGEATRRLAEMTPPRVGKVRFVLEAAAPPGGVRIASDSWLTLGEEPGAPPRLARTNDLAVIPAGRTASNEVRAVEITTPEETAAIRAGFADAGGEPPPLPPGVAVEVVSMSDYKHGAGRRGVYLTAPGPSPVSEAGFLPLSLAFSFFVYWAIAGTGQPGNMVRLMAFDTTRTLRRGLCVLTIYFALIYFPLVIIFTCARVLAPGLDADADRIMPVVAFTLSREAGVPWLAGFLVAAPFAAAMSTVDSFMLMISSSVVRDIYQRNINPEVSQRRIKLMSYACTLIAGGAITVGAINPPNFMQYLIVFTGGGLAVAFLTPVALALYWPRFNGAGALASMVGGLGVYLALYVLGFVQHERAQPLRPLEMDPLIWGFAASLLAAVAVTLATPAPPRRLVERFFRAPTA